MTVVAPHDRWLATDDGTTEVGELGDEGAGQLVGRCGGTKDELTTLEDRDTVDAADPHRAGGADHLAQLTLRQAGAGQDDRGVRVLRQVQRDGYLSRDGIPAGPGGGGPGDPAAGEQEELVHAVCADVGEDAPLAGGLRFEEPGGMGTGLVTHGSSFQEHPRTPDPTL